MSCVVLSLHNREEPHVSRGKANRGFGEQSCDYHRNQRKNGSLRVSRARKRVVVRRVYVFAYAPDGTVLLNPAFPSREGRAYAFRHRIRYATSSRRAV